MSDQEINDEEQYDMMIKEFIKRPLFTNYVNSVVDNRTRPLEQKLSSLERRVKALEDRPINPWNPNANS